MLENPVTGQEHQTFAIVIEPAHRVNVRHGDETGKCQAWFIRLRGTRRELAQDIKRLIEKQIAEGD